ncbi:death ligand signal enhancer isoform X4 [Mustela erminea]|uniref:death ligand signal enhancer isoform X4 n=1 Tax=Mustela erminea TaxID=36723 RepID=UPI001386D144|nr:death ligand signal enhancer isoform X4 [Mustela erminea]
MWRLPGLLGRALPRLLGPGLWGVTPKSTNPAGPQAASSNLLVPVPSFDRSGPHGPGPGTNRGPRSHGWKDAFQWMSSRVSPNTLWDAVSWGTLAVLALQLARQIHFQSSLPAGPRQAGCCSWRSPLDRFLSSSLWHPCSSLRRHILPSPDVPAPRHTDPREPRLGQEECSTQPENLSSHSSLRASGPQGPCEEDPSDLSFLSTSGNFQPRAEPAQLQSTGEKQSLFLPQEQEKSKTLSLEEAVTSIQQLFQLTISIAFNFLGTENMRNGDYVAAFSYFQKAADYGYSKAQYNVGLCHEHGRGTPKDLGKDSQSRYHLGICFEKGLGVRRSLGEAVRCYQQSAALGNEPAQERLQTLFSMEAAGKALGTSNPAVKGLKSFSSPSLHSFNTLLAGASHLPHASTTGNLGLLCRSGRLRASPGAPNITLPPFSYPLERSLVRLGFG